MKEKICFVASSGGHLEEITCIKEIADQKSSFLITEKDGFNNVKIGSKTYYVEQINRRERMFILHFIQLFIRTYKILKIEDPEVVISTGALIAFPVCLIAKLQHKKVIYIESFARVDCPSLTGRLVYRFADLFIVQWTTMLDVYPKAVYTGGIF